MAPCSLVLLVAAVCGVSIAQIQPNYRLSREVLPVHYNIHLTPYLTASVANKTQFTFDAVTAITLNTVLTNQNQIVLHANQLTFSSIVLSETNNAAAIISVNRQTTEEVTNKLTLGLELPLRANVNYTLTFAYVGILQSNMNGFYRSSYMENGTVRWVATTQMEPVHAREVFPSFDEPSFKATFDVSITRPADYEPSIANTRIKETVPNASANTVTEHFFTTPIMSTYLLAFIVSQFRVRSNADGSFGVIARPEAYDQTEYAFNVGPKTLAKLDEYTAYRYDSVPSMTKMHMAALPDFSAGAMENWGLLTYRETALLYTTTDSTDLAQQRVASVITHEQAHMWFGDLVTCEWWSYTWLNEGFARFFQYFGTALVEDTWDLELQFVVEQLQAALLYDSQDSTHPLTYAVNSPAEISAVFDSISYNKGASVLRMTQHIIGADNFRNAIREYLKTNEFGVSTPEKLFTSLQRFTPTVPIQLSIASFLNGWTTQSGYPVITIDRQDATHVVVSQERFYLQNRVQNDTTRWEVPLSFATHEQPNFTSTAPRVLLSASQASITLTMEAAANWTVFNVQQTGYYRVNYDAASWENIRLALHRQNHSGIHVLNRAQIIDDVLNLARAEYVNYTLALGVVQYLENETNYTPWLAAFNNLNFVSIRLAGENATLYQEHIKDLTKFIYTKLGFTPKSTDSRIDVYNRIQILQLLCKYGHEDCIKQSNEEFAKLSNSNYIIPPNIRPIVYCSVVANESAGAWDTLFNRFQTTNSAAEQVVILSALGCTKNQATLKRYLDAIFTDVIRLQDKAAAFSSTYSQQNSNVDFVLDYVIANDVKISGSMGVSGILSSLASRFTSATQIEKLVQFRNSNSTYLTTTVNRAIENAQSNLVWSEKNVPVIVQYIKSHSGTGQLTATILLLAFAALFALFH